MSLRLLDLVCGLAEKAVAAFNFLEALFWLAVAAGFLRAAVKSKAGNAGVLYLAAFVLALFGMSDFVEVETGAWWRPWWLLVWKGTCLVTLVTLYVRHRMETRRQPAKA